MFQVESRKNLCIWTVSGRPTRFVAMFAAIDILWLDGGVGDYDTPGLAEMARGYQPGMLVVHRAQGGRYENYRTPEQEMPDEHLPYARETCMTVGDYWTYNPDDYFKSARELIHLLVEIVCKGVTFRVGEKGKRSRHQHSQ